MKSNRLLILIVLLLIIVAAVYIFSNPNGTLKPGNTGFLIQSADKISEIKISSSQEQIRLSKKNNTWELNGKYKVNDVIIANFLNALTSIDILTPVSKVERNQISNILKKEGILVELRDNKFFSRKFFVNQPTMSKDKTYMMMTNSQEPYIVRIPDFKGQVSQLFITNENFWRDKTVFNYLPQHIKSITVEYPRSNTKSFKVAYNKGTFTLQNLNEGEYEQDFNIEKVAQYFTNFQNVKYENKATLAVEKIDSVKQSVAYCIISVEDYNGAINKLEIFRKDAENNIDEFGNKAGFDYNRAYAVFNNNDELLVIQYYNFDLIFKEIDYFR